MAESPLKTVPGRIVKYTVEHYRKDGVSAEAFDDWFTNVVAPKAVPVYKKHNFIKVAIYKTDHKVSAAFQGILEQARPGWKVSDCDIVLEHWVHDMETVMAHASDPEWTSEVLKDQEKWVDISKSTIHIGYETTCLEDKAIMNLEDK